MNNAYFERIKRAVIILLFIFAAFTVAIHFTKAYNAIISLNPFFLSLACISFFIAIFFWNISLYVLLSKTHKLRIKDVLYAAYASCFASLTPMQLGTDAMKAYILKKRSGVRMSKTITACMLAKGFKFLILLLAGVFVFAYVSKEMKFYFLLGLCVVLISLFLFFLPFKFGLPKFLSKSKYLSALHTALKEWPRLNISEVFLLVIFSSFAWFFELLTFYFSFLSINESISLFSASFVFIMLAILERVPFTARGLVLIELLIFIYFSNIIAVPKIVALAASYDFARLILPVVFSMVLFSARGPTGKTR